MPISDDKYPWNKDNVDAVAPKGATYALYDDDDECIYIGSSSDLNDRFVRYWNQNFGEDMCKRATVAYKREYRTDYKERERELLKEYKRKHGKLPRCNDVIP